MTQQTDEGNVLTNIKKEYVSQPITTTIGIAALLLNALAFAALAYQLHQGNAQAKLNNDMNRVSIRGQLFEGERLLFDREITDESNRLSSLWAYVETDVRGLEYSKELLKCLTDEEEIINVKNASELNKLIFDVKTFQTDKKREATRTLRRAYFHTQSNLYHLHTSQDYHEEKILSTEEWETWKGLLQEMGPHPILIATIQQGHVNKYFSKSFGKFLQRELCAEITPPDVSDPDRYARGREFVKIFYREMCDTNWTDNLPDYSQKSE